jgi:hypothetical protein
MQGRGRRRTLLCRHAAPPLARAARRRRRLRGLDSLRAVRASHSTTTILDLADARSMTSVLSALSAAVGWSSPAAHDAALQKEVSCVPAVPLGGC